MMIMITPWLWLCSEFSPVCGAGWNSKNSDVDLENARVARNVLSRLSGHLQSLLTGILFLEAGAQVCACAECRVWLELIGGCGNLNESRPQEWLAENVLRSHQA